MNQEAGRNTCCGIPEEGEDGGPAVDSIGVGRFQCDAFSGVLTLGNALVTEVRDLGDGRRGLFQRVAFAVDVNPVARIAYGLYKGGFLRAVSVGFIPLRWEEGNEKSQFSRRYLEQELLEVSAVAVPANPEALALGLRAGAVEKADLREWAGLLTEAAGGAVDEVAATRRAPLELARELREVLRG